VRIRRNRNFHSGQRCGTCVIRPDTVAGPQVVSERRPNASASA
jgi:hypothetical protein